MAEALGVVASALQIAELGYKLSKNIYSYVETVSSADKRLEGIGRSVEFTSSVITQVSEVFEQEDAVKHMKPRAIQDAKRITADCDPVFKDIDNIINKAKKNKYTLPFREPQLELHRANLDRLKLDLSLLLQFLTFSQQISTDDAKRREMKELIKERDHAIWEYQQLSLKFTLMLQAGDENVPTYGEATSHNTPSGDLGINSVNDNNPLHNTASHVSNESGRDMEKPPQRRPENPQDPSEEEPAQGTRSPPRSVGPPTRSSVSGSSTSESIRPTGDKAITALELRACADRLYQLLGRITELQRTIDQEHLEKLDVPDSLQTAYLEARGILDSNILSLDATDAVRERRPQPDLNFELAQGISHARRKSRWRHALSRIKRPIRLPCFTRRVRADYCEEEITASRIHPITQGLSSTELEALEEMNSVDSALEPHPEPYSQIIEVPMSLEPQSPDGSAIAPKVATDAEVVRPPSPDSVDDLLREWTTVYDREWERNE